MELAFRSDFAGWKVCDCLLTITYPNIVEEQFAHVPIETLSFFKISRRLPREKVPETISDLVLGRLEWAGSEPLLLHGSGWDSGSPQHLGCQR